MRCLVTGATGYVGARVVPGLLARGHEVRAMARDPAKLVNAPWRLDAEVVKADLTDRESVARACDGVDVVYYLVHSMGTSASFRAQERRTATILSEAARSAGVRRIVYLGGLHPEHCALSEHLQSRTAVGDVLLDSGIETVILQAGIIIGSGSASFEMIRHLTDRLPVMTAPKWVHNKIQPIAIQDALHYLVEAATAPVPASGQWDVGGPDVLEYGEMMQVYAEVAGLRRRVIVVLPFLTPTIASWWVGLVTPIPAGLARPLVESLHCDAVMADHDIDTVIAPPSAGLTGYRDAVRLALLRTTQAKVESSWGSAASDGAPSAPLPSDPKWAGEVAYRASRSAWTPATPAELWKSVNDTAVQHRWRLEKHKPGELLLVRTHARRPGQAWLEMRVREATGSGSHYEQRAIFYPRGIAGRVYWYLSLPLHRNRFRQIFRKVTARAAASHSNGS